MSILKQRRQFLAKMGASLSGLLLTACSDKPPLSRYNDADIELLKQQRVNEASNSGSGAYGPQRYNGYRGLAELPWFEIDHSGVLQCVDNSIPKAIDVHSHLGMSVLFKPDLDLHKSTQRVMHLLDCDAIEPGCELDLDVYINSNFDSHALETLQDSIVAQGLWGSRFAESQTIPNFLAEMDSMRVEQAMVLPIKLGFWFGDDLTETWRAAIHSSRAEQRLLAGFSVHPRDGEKIAQMRKHAASGLKVMKLHPTVQRFYPDNMQLMDVYAEAEKLGVIVFFHGGRAGIESESSHRYAMPRHYEAVFANFPKLQFVVGHAGARDNQAMLALALKYENVWLGIHGQSVSSLDNMIQQTGGERLLFGTDWPFYHIASSLAKVLITTDASGRQSIREKILRGNAQSLFADIYDSERRIIHS